MESDIEKVKEIMSSKEKFIKNVCNVSFTFKKFINNVIHNMELIEFISYNAQNFHDLKELYDLYKSIGCDKLEIKSVAKADGEMFEYSIVLYKKNDITDYIVYVEMLLGTYTLG